MDSGLPPGAPPPPSAGRPVLPGLLGRLTPAALRRPSPKILEWQLLFDRAIYLPPILARQDRMSMAHSIEARVPYLSNRFLQLPPLALPGKRPLKERAAEVFGKRFARRRKCGFGFPTPWLGSIDISDQHLGWLRDSWKPANDLQRWALASLSKWAYYYLCDGWKSVTPAGAKSAASARPPAGLAGHVE